MSDKQEVPEIPEKCVYCHGEDCDHKHGEGSSCGHCCSMHGGLSSIDTRAYKWVEDCLTAKNAALATLKARVKELEQIPDYWKEAIGGPYKGTVLTKSRMVHLPPGIVKQALQEYSGTLAADVIAGLTYSTSIAENRAQLFVEEINEKCHEIAALEAENERLRKALEEIQIGFYSSKEMRKIARAALSRPTEEAK